MPSRLTRSRAFFAGALLLLPTGCGGRQEEPRPDDEPASSPAVEAPSASGTSQARPRYATVEVTDGGNLIGQVRWVGARPPMEPLPVTKDQGACGQTTPFPALSIGEGGGVSHTFVFVDGITQGRAFPAVSDANTPTIDQAQCVYTPRVAGVGLRRPIAFRNSDGVLHNVHSFFEDGQSWFNIAQPTRGTVSRRTAERPGIVRVVCDAGHTWMTSYVHVMAHPYFAVTDGEGRFRIEGLPPGQHTVRAWHEGWRVVGTSSGRRTFSPPVVLTEQATVTAGQDATVTFELSSAAGGA